MEELLARPHGQKGLGLARARTRARARNGVRSPSWQVAEQGLARAGALWASLQSSGRSGPAAPCWGLPESPPRTPMSLRYRSDIAPISLRFTPLRFTPQELEPECKWPLLTAAWRG